MRARQCRQLEGAVKLWGELQWSSRQPSRQQPLDQPTAGDDLTACEGCLAAEQATQPAHCGQGEAAILDVRLLDWMAALARQLLSRTRGQLKLT